MHEVRPNNLGPPVLDTGQGFGSARGTLADCKDACREAQGAVGRGRYCAGRMRRPARTSLLMLSLACPFGLAACGKSSTIYKIGGGRQPIAPIAAQGAVSVVTRNTTRLGGGNAADDAAAVARAVYPGLTPASRPGALVLVDEHDWSAALASAVLAGAPAGAPIL